MTGILTLTRNNIALTQRAIHSFLRQDVPATVKVIDNGSSDGVKEWVENYGWLLFSDFQNTGVSAGWNRGLQWFFDRNFEAVLVCGNDVWLPSYFLRELLSYNLPFVTGVAVDNMEQIQKSPNKCPLDPHPDFSAFLVRRECWKAVGCFEETMKHYAQDCSWHIRAHRLGIPLWKASCEFFHERSSTLRNASEQERQEIIEQANKDRAVFRSLYGCLPGTAEYEAIFVQNPTSQRDHALSRHDSTARTGI